MFKADAEEAVPICDRILNFMLAATATTGRTGSDFRTAIGDFLADAQHIIQDDLAGPPLADIFDKARLAGVTQKQLTQTRVEAAKETPATVGATLIRDSLINFSLATEGRIIADMTFTSRDDVEALNLIMNKAFQDPQEIAADSMDQQTFRALVELHAAISFHLVQTARPLPRMLEFQFAVSMPTLVTAYRLYADAGRADELRLENKVVHPGFMLPYGRALGN
jgi:prophage DNA circulation protein